MYNIVWPPPPEEPEVPTACPLYFPPSTHLKVIPKEHQIQPLDTLDSENYSELEDMDNIESVEESKEVLEITGRRSAMECIGTISETVETQRLVECVLKNRPPSPPAPPQIAKDQVPPESSCSVRCSTVSLASTEEFSSSTTSNIECRELKKLTDFKPNTIECKLKSQVENSVPQRWESPLLQALRTVPDPESKGDPFTQIPSKHSSSALASALAIAPPEPFTAHKTNTTCKAVPLPEMTEPYFPPEHPTYIETRELSPTISDKSTTSIERPYKKKKDPTDEFFKDLPKPQKKLTMREALMTASDRPYSPLFDENSQQTEDIIEKPRLEKPKKPASLPESFEKSVEPKIQVPKPFPIRFEETRVQSNESQVIEKHDLKTVEIAPEVQTSLPLFTGFNCSFENKSEHSQFKVEISTTPPVINPERITPSVKITRSEESCSETQTQNVQTIEKQAEEVVYKKPLPLVSNLHKPQTLPQYQVNISDNAEADLQMIERIETAKARHEQQKIEVQKKPVVVVQPGDTSHQVPFKPVCEDRPQSTTFSPRPRTVTPSMINKPPPTIPYYQANLVAQQYKAADSNLLDPKSPAVSRSPTPRVDRSPSPFPSTASSVRPKSPAAGPPPNPLKSNTPLPTPRDSKVEEAKKNLCNYIPQHQSKAPARIEQTRFCTEQVSEGQTSLLVENRQIDDQLKNRTTCQETQEGVLTTNVSEKSHLDHLEQLSKSESQSVEKSGSVQIQRKKTVTEEFEHTQKCKTVEIEKNFTTAHPFKNVNNPVIEEQGITGLHVTNPQPIVSPFLRKDSKTEDIQCSITKRDSLKAEDVQQTRIEDTQLEETNAPLIKRVIAPSLTSPIKHVPAPSGSQKPNQNVNRSNIPVPNAGAGGGRQTGAIGIAPRRGRGVLNTSALGGTRVPLCASCHSQIR